MNALANGDQRFLNEVSEGVMSKDDVSNFITCQIMVDYIVLPTDVHRFLSQTSVQIYI